MSAYRQVYDSRHLQADCEEPESPPDPTLGNGVLATFTFIFTNPQRIEVMQLEIYKILIKFLGDHKLRANSR